MQLNCPMCNVPWAVPDNIGGTTVRCPTCGHQFAAGGGKPQAAPPPPAPATIQCTACAEMVPADATACPHCRTPLRAAAPVPVASAPPGQVPGKVQAIAIMTLVGGIVAVLAAFSIMIGTFFIYIPWIYGFVVGIMAIVKGAKLLGSNARLEMAPKNIAIMQIINIINCDAINLTVGIITLVFLNDPEVRGFYRQPQR